MVVSAREHTPRELSDLVRDAGWSVDDDFLLGVSDYDRDFMKNELTGSRTKDYYARRLDMIGFDGGACVLDAACGVGQWSVVLSERYTKVVGVDINAGRLAVARRIAAAHRREGCRFEQAALERLPLASQSCDAVFCYGAFMFTDMPLTLREFRRVIRPGGKLYLNANSTGWCAHLFIDRGLCAGNLGLMRAALRMTVRTLAGRTSQTVVRRKWLLNRLTEAGFSPLAMGAEGTICLRSTGKVEAAYPSRFYGLTSILEVVADA